MKLCSKLKIMLAAMTGAAALALSLPGPGSLSFTSSALASDGGGDGGGMDAIADSRARQKNASGFHRGSSRIWQKRKKRRVHKRGSSQRWHKSARKRKIRKSRKRHARVRKQPEKRFWYVLEPGYVPETREQKMQRMIETKLREEVALKQDMQRQFAEFYMRQQLKAFANSGRPAAAPVAAPAPAPAAQPVVWPTPNRNTAWARSTNPMTGITTTSVAMGNGAHAITLTNAAGNIVNRFVVNR